MDVSLIQNFLQLAGNMMIEQDPPEHTRFRKLANQGFTTRTLESWQSILQNTTDALLDQVCIYGMQAVVAQQMETFQQFPPRQKPAAFNLDAGLRDLEEAGSRRNH